MSFTQFIFYPPLIHLILSIGLCCSAFNPNVSYSLTGSLVLSDQVASQSKIYLVIEMVTSQSVIQAKY